ncbi:MAG: hypothetical protein J5659_03190 [Clostridia bacterium]|nr:hypothetical protein [Clostridia bacterium]
MTEQFFSGIFSGALIGAVISIFTLRFHYRELYAKSISSSRMQWINDFREEVSTIIATLKANKSDINKTQPNKIVYKAEQARAKLLTRINMNTSQPGNEYNDVFAKLLLELDFNNTMDINIDDTTRKLTELSREILEYEWKRVKDEARGKR